MYFPILQTKRTTNTDCNLAMLLNILSPLPAPWSSRRWTDGRLSGAPSARRPSTARSRTGHSTSLIRGFTFLTGYILVITFLFKLYYSYHFYIILLYCCVFLLIVILIWVYSAVFQLLSEHIDYFQQIVKGMYQLPRRPTCWIQVGMSTFSNRRIFRLGQIVEY